MECFKEQTVVIPIIRKNIISVYSNKKNKIIIPPKIIPEKIEGKYTENYNIFYIDGIIKNKLEHEMKTKIPFLLEDKRNLEKKLTSRLNEIEIITLKNKISLLKKEIDMISTGQKMSKYLEESKGILDRFKVFHNKYNIVDITEKPKIFQYTEDMLMRFSLIDKYLLIAGKYIKISLKKEINYPKDICLGCATSIVDISFDEEGIKTCTKCYTKHYESIINTKEVEINHQVEAESIENFIKAIQRFQGLQEDRPPVSLYSRLDEYFISNKRLSSLEIKKLPLNEKGRRGDTTHSMLLNALSKIGASQYYEDVNLIGKEYWGWQLYDISNVIDSMIDKYVKTQKGFYSMTPEERGRNSNLGTQYRLYQQLRLEGVPVEISEFKIAENIESRQIHEKLWKKMCELSEDPDIYFIE
jgi:hypothetical protein